MLDISTLVLQAGSHSTREAGLCAMEAVAWLANEPHSDAPACTCPVIASFVRAINDTMPSEERQKLVAYLPRLIGTQVDTAAKVKRAELIALATIRTIVPIALRAIGLNDHADKLACFDGTLSAASAASDAASRAASDAASDASFAARYAASAAHSASYAADDAASYTASLAASAASDAASFAASAAARSAAASDASAVWAAVFLILDAALDVK